MRRIVAALLVLMSVAQAVDETAVLAAARAASNEYQNRFERLARELKHDNETARIEAVRTLGSMHDPQSVPLILPFLEFSHRSPAEVTVAASALGRLGYKSALPALRALTSHADKGIRESAVLALHQIGVIGAGDWMPRAKDDDDVLRLNALVGLGQLQHAEATEALIQGLHHEKPLVRQAACVGIGRLGDRALGEKLRVCMTDQTPSVRRYAAEALAKLNYTPAIPDLLMALEANIAGEYILHALRVLTQEDFGFDPKAPLLMRRDAIDRGFAWWAAHPELAK